MNDNCVFVFQDKEETEKEAAEIKENGVSDTETPKTPEADSAETCSSPKDELANEVVSSPEAESAPEPAEKEKAAEESGDSKDGAKKIKEKKKKKWSFRSISFSKKDKSKPSKDAEKNGEVKEVVEEVSTDDVGYIFSNFVFTRHERNDMEQEIMIFSEYLDIF